MAAALEKPWLISLAAGFTDNPSLPVTQAREIVSSMLRGKAGQPPLQYGTTAGDEKLRTITARRLAKMDGQSATARAGQPGRMLITPGSQTSSSNNRRAMPTGTLSNRFRSVSYTKQTLPTIYSV